MTSQQDGAGAGDAKRLDGARGGNGQPAAPVRQVVVIGGGITGLAAAHHLREIAPQVSVRVLEASDRLGGVLHTVRADGFLFEDGPDNFITNVPWGVDLCRRLGFEDQLLETNEANRRAFVISRGRLAPLPSGFLVMAPTRVWPLVVTPILSPWGKLRLAWEYFTPQKRDDQEESLAQFATRRFGREAYERLVQPLVCSIYTADPEKLSVAATMDRFVEMERTHGGLIKAVRKAAAARSKSGETSGARYSLFVAPREGVSSLIQALADRLPTGAIHTNAPVARITARPEGGWFIELDRPGAAREQADAIIVAVPARCAGPMVQQLDPALAADLQTITYNSCALVSLGYRRQQVAHPLDGFGYVTPMVERRQVLSGSFSSVKYPGRAPEGHLLLRVFIGGGLQGELVDLPDDRLQQLAEQELAELLGAQGPPVCCRIWRSRLSMPQYELGHTKLVTRIQSRVGNWPHLAVAGNAYGGVGIPHCIHSGQTAAEAVLGS